MSDPTKFDAWLTDDGPAALVIREPLMPVEGADGVVFPATYAAQDGADRDKSKFQGGYNIDGDLQGKNVCLIDSVGSQANRIEPMFAKEKYAALIPQVSVKAGSKTVSLLEAGHRAGDALVRCSALQKELQDAFKAVLRGDAEPLAKIAPTSLVFGVWDSRDTQAKLPRLISSTIRAFDVRKLTRSAQFNPSTEYVKDGLLEDTTDTTVTSAYAERGFIHVPASGSHGGVIATGGIRRDATLSLAALRLLAVRKADGTLAADQTQALRRYILGLALTALTQPPTVYLRQGCNLVIDPDKTREFNEVYGDGRRVPSKLTHDDALVYATAAATAFKIGPDKTVDFDKTAAERDVSGAPADAGTKKVSGTIDSVDAGGKKFVVRKGQTKTEVTTNEATTYFKKDDPSTADVVVKKSNRVDVEVDGGVAVKVTLK